MEQELGASLDEQISTAVKILVSGGVIAFPTDTVYGLGALHYKFDAVQRVYRIKNRSTTKALPLIIADYNQLEDVTSYVPSDARLLMQAFWPGALTLVLPKSNNISYEITGGLDTVAVRMPNHKVPLSIAMQAGTAVCATSANLSGGKVALTAEEVAGQLGSSIDFIINYDISGDGVPSTLIDVTGEKIEIIRKGSITFEQISKVCNVTLKEVDL